MWNAHNGIQCSPKHQIKLKSELVNNLKRSKVIFYSSLPVWSVSFASAKNVASQIQQRKAIQDNYRLASGLSGSFQRRWSERRTLSLDFLCSPVNRMKTVVGGSPSAEKCKTHSLTILSLFTTFFTLTAQHTNYPYVNIPISNRHNIK